MLKVYAYYFETLVFRFSVGPDDIPETPAWLDTEDFPPLSPRAAIETSRLVVLDMLKDYPCAEPGFHACALKKTHDSDRGWWYYEVEWRVYPPEYGDRSSLTVPVLLNGRVPAYDVFDYEDRALAWQG